MSAPLRAGSLTTWQRAYATRAARTADDLARWAAVDDEARARRSLGRRLAGLRRGMWAAPGWRSRLAAQGLSPDDLRSLDDLRAFPVLDRSTLAADGADLVGRPEGLFVLRSSGSTGRPLTVYRDAWETLHMWAVLRFLLRQLGIDAGPRPRVVLLCSLPSGIALSRRVPLLGDGALHRIAIAHGDAAQRLRRVRPAVVFSDPAGLQWLARQDVPAPRLILSSAQHLWDTLRAALPAPVVDYYSTTETGPIAWRCPGGSRFHVLSPEMWAQDEGGALVVTRLRRGPWPLVRYATGDGGRVGRDACGCGFRGWSISALRGRGRAELVKPDGTLADAWQLAWLFKDAPLAAFRLTQQAPESFVLEIAGGDAAAVVPGLARALRSLGWTNPHVESRTVAALDVPGGKPAPFVRAF